MCEAIRTAANSANNAAVLRGPSCDSVARVLVHRAGRGHSRIKLDLAKGAFVVGDILVQNRSQRLGLLRAQVNALKISYLDLIFRLLLHGAEHEKEVPNIDPHLHTVGISLAILSGIDDAEIRLRGDNHGKQSSGNEGRRKRGKIGSGLQALGFKVYGLSFEVWLWDLSPN